METAEKKRPARVQKDGKWRSFPKVPHLLQNVSTRAYYARVKVKGKPIQKSLKTTVGTTAKLRLPDFLKEHQQKRCDICKEDRDRMHWLGLLQEVREMLGLVPHTHVLMHNHFQLEVEVKGASWEDFRDRHGD